MAFHKLRQALHESIGLSSDWLFFMSPRGNLPWPQKKFAGYFVRAFLDGSTGDGRIALAPRFLLLTNRSVVLLAISWRFAQRDSSGLIGNKIIMFSGFAS